MYPRPAPVVRAPGEDRSAEQAQGICLIYLDSATKRVDNVRVFGLMCCIYNIMKDKFGTTEAAELAKTMGAECIAYRVRVLNRIVTSIYDAELLPLGITVNQATMLIMLSIVGEAGPSLISKALVMEKSTVSRNLSRMKKQGWIKASEGGRGLAQIITVTPKGRKMLASMHGAWQKAQEAAARLLGGSGVAAVHDLHGIMRKTANSA